MFNKSRLIVARRRRRFSSKGLADAIGMSPVTVTRLESGYNEPEDSTVEAIARVLEFPIEFFYGDDVDEISKEAASFRSLTAMSAKEREAALAAGSLAYLLADWVSARFNLPEADLLDLSFERSPPIAARTLRQHWGLGEQPIAHMIKMLEAKGVRVFSLAENTRNVDAFSCWRNGTPYIFLNTFKSTEHSRFDAAHELGHLVLHKHGGPQQGRAAEMEANDFASAFLMPDADVRGRIPRQISLSEVVAAKKRWGVSAAALAYRLHKLCILSDWHYRSMCIEMNRRGYRSSEPESMPREDSFVWKQIFKELWSDKVTRGHIASDLHIPPGEIENLVFGLVGQRQILATDQEQRRPSLRLI